MKRSSIYTAPAASPSPISAPRSAPELLLLLLLLGGCKLFDPCKPYSGNSVSQGEMSVFQSGCTRHEDCPSQICEQCSGDNRMVGACRDPAQVLVVNGALKACSGAPTQIVPPEPFCTIQAAIDYALKNYSGAAAIRVLSKAHTENLEIKGGQTRVTSLALYGPVTLTPKEAKALVTIRNLQVQLDQVSLLGEAAGVRALQGLDCGAQSELTLCRAEVRGMRYDKARADVSGRGISADACRLRVDRTLLMDNQAEAVLVESSPDALISNSIFTKNSSSKQVLRFVNSSGRVLLSTLSKNDAAALDGQPLGDAPAVDCGNAEVKIQDSIVVSNRQRALDTPADMAQSLGKSQLAGTCAVSTTTVIGPQDAWPVGQRVTPRFLEDPSVGGEGLPVLDASAESCACCTNKATTCAGFGKASATAQLHDEAPRDYLGTLRPCVGADVGAYEAP